MSNIKLLDKNTINKIAAGEVIERPASVIKELVENSIDALASFITIEIKEGGKSYIRVTDNGTGIDKDDVELAFLRHSTSKINKIDDLQSLSTLGFRGEALASIAAVSQLELITRTKNSIEGVHVFVNGGKIVERSEIGCPIGTTIIIKNLFYNVPVRKKFLKSDTVESSYISDIVYKLALGNPGLRFKYIKDSKIIINTPGRNDIKSTIYSLFGKEFINSVFDIEYSGNDIKICGIISKPTFTRGNRNHQYTYVNGRYIKSEEISKIIEQQYKTKIPANRFPVYAIYINIKPEMIDVNVHPTKTEIRFQNIEKLKEALTFAINSAFSNNNLIPEVSIPVPREYSKNVLEKQETFLDSDNKNDDEILRRDSIEKNSFLNKSIEQNNNGYITNNDKSNIDNSIDVDNIIRIIDYSINESSDTNYIEKKAFLPILNIIGTMFDTYILAEDRANKDLYIIDQHAAHERIMYEKIKKQLESNEIYKQQLLTPLIINLSYGEMELIEENKDIFSRIGFDIENFGFNSIMVRSIPLVFGTPHAKDLLLDIIDNLKNNKIHSSYEVRIDKIMKLACSSAIKAGHNIKEAEINALLDDLAKTKQPYTCPHGRPIIIKISKYEIEKRFKRV